MSSDVAEIPKTTSMDSDLPRVKHRKRDKVKVAVKKMVGKEAELPERPIDKTLEVFIKYKLKEWDQDQSGHFTADECEAAIEELKSVMDGLASLKWTVIIGSVILTFTVILVLGAAAIAMELSKDTSIGSQAEMMDKNTGNRIVTAEDEGVGELPSVLEFDAGNDQWALSDPELRNLQSVSLQVSDGEFFHMNVATVMRYDSGPGADQDKLHIITESGAQVRWWESTGDVEMKLCCNATDTQWLAVNTDPDRRRLREFVNADEWTGSRPYIPVEDFGPINDFSVLPPKRLLSKGHYTSGVWVHSRGGHYRCDPAYVDGRDDPDMYCDSATRLTGSVLAFLFFVRVVLRT